MQFTRVAWLYIARFFHKPIILSPPWDCARCVPLMSFDKLRMSEDGLARCALGCEVISWV